VSGLDFTATWDKNTWEYMSPLLGRNEDEMSHYDILPIFLSECSDGRKISGTKCHSVVLTRINCDSSRHACFWGRKQTVDPLDQ
jgi:hypothetical protein